MRHSPLIAALATLHAGPIALAQVGDTLFRLLPDAGYEALQFGEDVALESGLALISGLGIFTTPIPGGAFLIDPTTGAHLATFAQPIPPGETEPRDARFFGVDLSEPITLPAGHTAPVALIGTAEIAPCVCYRNLVRVFDLANPASPALLHNLIPDDATSDDAFGDAIDIDGSTALIGASFADGVGAAYLFDVATGQQLGKLTASDPDPGDQFGFSVDLQGNLAIIGARSDDERASNAGAAYIFDISDPTSPVQLAKLTPDNADDQDFFGFAVAIHADTAVVGAIFDDDLGFDAGAAYIYDLANTAGPTLVRKLLAPDGQDNDDFGWAIALEPQGSRLVAIVGARTDDDAGPGAGSAYLYDLTTPASPLLVEKFLPEPTSGVDTFGWAVDLDGPTALVGAPMSDEQGSASGSAYLIDAELGPSPCSLADLAEPFGILDLDDADTFINAFLAQDPAADLTPPSGIIDLGDVDAFINAFLAGCP